MIINNKFTMTPEEEQAEVCKLNKWCDQIDLKMFICAECKKSVCMCDTYKLKDLIKKSSSTFNNKTYHFTTTRRPNHNIYRKRAKRSFENTN